MRDIGSSSILLSWNSMEAFLNVIKTYVKYHFLCDLRDVFDLVFTSNIDVIYNVQVPHNTVSDQNRKQLKRFKIGTILKLQN